VHECRNWSDRTQHTFFKVELASSSSSSNNHKTTGFAGVAASKTSMEEQQQVLSRQWQKPDGQEQQQQPIVAMRFHIHVRLAEVLLASCRGRGNGLTPGGLPGCHFPSFPNPSCIAGPANSAGFLLAAL
jgi:hypothetical protein